MEKFKIHLAGRKFYHWRFLQIHLLRWFVFPIRKRYDGKAGLPQPGKDITFYQVSHTCETLDDCHTMRAGLCHRGAYSVSWLFFTIVLTKVYWDDDLIRIFSKYYNHEADDFQGAKRKYEALCETGYFA